MANSLTAFTPEYWSKRIQVLLRRSSIGLKVANTEERTLLRDGDVVHRPYHSDPYVVDYTKGSAITIQDISTTDESLTVNQSKVTPVYVDDDDVVQNKYDTANKLIDRSVEMLKRDMDYAVLKEVENATYDIDDGDIGGTAGNAIQASTSNMLATTGAAYATLAAGNVEQDKSWDLIVDPFFVNTMTQTGIAAGFNVADMFLKNGFVGNWNGFNVFQSNALFHTASINIATEPTADDTVVVNGVTFTFKAAPAAAGEVDLSGTAATTVDNLVAAINGTGTPSATTYIALTAANRAKLKNSQVLAVDATTSITMTAAGRMTLAETFTDTTDNVGIQTGKFIASRRGSIDLVAQVEPKMIVKDVPDKLGKNYFSHTLYGVKTFQEGADRMCEINVQASAATPVV